MARLARKVVEHLGAIEQGLEGMAIAHIGNIYTQKKIASSRGDVAQVTSIAGVEAVDQGAGLAVIS